MGKKLILMKVGIYLIVLCIVVLLLANCKERSSEVQINLLPGKYCFNEGNSNDSLFLFENRSYTHKFFLSETEIYKSKGSWRFDSLTNKISFYDFIFYNEMGPINESGGVWNSKIHITKEGEIRLIYSRENGIYYFKR
ncbi:MAG TPA: hypothetical protein DIS90_11455 [Cytophagales bacterium]|nr:hypothetical protein [Cytophagales bacterium]